jgi:hypothetical protein
MGRCVLRGGLFPHAFSTDGFSLLGRRVVLHRVGSVYLTQCNLVCYGVEKQCVAKLWHRQWPRYESHNDASRGRAIPSCQ